MRWLVVWLLALAGCSGPRAPVCGEGAEPVIVTGLNGLVDGEVPAVEIQLLVPDTCEVLDTRWMSWDEDGQTVVLSGEPEGDHLARGGVEVSDDVIFFRDVDLGVRLEYPAREIAGALTLTWFTAATDLVAVDCMSASGALECALRTP